MCSVRLCLLLLTVGQSLSYFGFAEDNLCFCHRRGDIDACTCNEDSIDYFNNVKIYPRLRSLLARDYFRFYKVDLRRECPFWADDGRCAIRYCHVEACQEGDVPPGLKDRFVPADPDKECDRDHDPELSFLNTTISAKIREGFTLWKAFDDAQENFCVTDENGDGAGYVDLLLNPERYTGYRGYSAHRIWSSIYMENCFGPSKGTPSSYVRTERLGGMCLEKRAFHRAISGLHASINVHLCAEYLLSEQTESGLVVKGKWGPNPQEFKRRFSPEATGGEGPNWLGNLYFDYLLELRALVKASPYLQEEEFYTGDEAEDRDTKRAVGDLLNAVKGFGGHFNESAMFAGGEEAQRLKAEFGQHFRNISAIMDCLGCDKCRLWGKLQIQGLGTALKILFSGIFDNRNPELYIREPKRNFQLRRTEIVALVNSIGRLSTSVYEVEEFRRFLR